MDVQPLRGSLGEAAFERLREGISGGKWAPGQRLPSERALAGHLAISRPALREAVKRLEGEGLIEIRPRKGLYVRAASNDHLGNSFERLIGTDFDRVNELLDLRRVLEHRSAYLAAEYASPEDIADLAAIFADIKRDVAEGGTGEEPDVRFHCAIAKAAGNTVLTHLMATLHGALAKASRLLASRLMESNHYRDGMFELHVRIYEAIRSHDPKAAAAAMDAHFDFVLREFSQYRARAGES
ncbi:MAG: FadR/GntR family transcriptional regulator [Proteobacteria bacterium]|nr:FadR/GntR family transcriptional regulator [Pseudomonadota bacterium]MDA1357257.1 FadR/GntR family transcriptional regulator [Pseudomonadota bacterium]